MGNSPEKPVYTVYSKAAYLDIGMHRGSAWLLGLRVSIQVRQMRVSPNLPRRVSKLLLSVLRAIGQSMKA